MVSLNHPRGPTCSLKPLKGELKGLTGSPRPESRQEGLGVVRVVGVLTEAPHVDKPETKKPSTYKSYLHVIHTSMYSVCIYIYIFIYLYIYMCVSIHVCTDIYICI